MHLHLEKVCALYFISNSSFHMIVTHRSDEENVLINKVIISLAMCPVWFMLSTTGEKKLNDKQYFTLHVIVTFLTQSQTHSW